MKLTRYFIAICAFVFAASFALAGGDGVYNGGGVAEKKVATYLGQTYSAITICALMWNPCSLNADQLTLWKTIGNSYVNVDLAKLSFPSGPSALARDPNDPAKISMGAELLYASKDVPLSDLKLFAIALRIQLLDQVQARVELLSVLDQVALVWMEHLQMFGGRTFISPNGNSELRFSLVGSDWYRNKHWDETDQFLKALPCAVVPSSLDVESLRSSGVLQVEVAGLCLKDNEPFFSTIAFVNGSWTRLQ